MAASDSFWIFYRDFFFFKSLCLQASEGKKKKEKQSRIYYDDEHKEIRLNT